MGQERNLFPLLRMRECWIHWVAGRWLNVVPQPAAIKRWFYSSKLLKRGVNSMAALDVCAAFFDSFPILGCSREVMIQAEAPLWEEVPPVDCAAFLDALRRPFPNREGMEGIVASLVVAAPRCASSIFLQAGGEAAPLLEVGSILCSCPRRACYGGQPALFFS